MSERGIVTMRKTGRADSTARTRMLSVPAEIAQFIPDGSRFRVELTDEGILYRPVDVPRREGGPPAWTEGVA